MKKFKALKLVLIVLAVLLALLLFGAWSMFRTQLTAAMTVEKLEDGLYSMEYIGDYGFDAFLAQGGAATDSKMADYIASFLSHGFWKPDSIELEPSDFGCSTISVRDSGGAYLFGRNYDWSDCTAMLVHTKPDGGFESISTCCLDFLGFGDGWLPESMMNKFLSLAAVYVPLDGMNERGLCVADLMAGDEAETHQNTDKPDVTVTAAIRMLLDYAANVEEAVNMLAEYDMNSSIGTAHHLAISDADGRCVVVEYIDGEMIVTETDVVTNFYLSDCDKYGVGSEQSHVRFDRLKDYIQASDGIMTADEVRSCLEKVAQNTFPDSDEATQWSIVYDKSAMTAVFYRHERFDKAYPMKLQSGDWLSAQD